MAIHIEAEGRGGGGEGARGSKVSQHLGILQGTGRGNLRYIYIAYVCVCVCIYVTCSALKCGHLRNNETETKKLQKEEEMPLIILQI